MQAVDKLLLAEFLRAAEFHQQDALLAALACQLAATAPLEASINDQVKSQSFADYFVSLSMFFTSCRLMRFTLPKYITSCKRWN